MSASLLRRVQELDRDAWRRLVHIYGPLVYRWARQAGLQESDAADLGQETFQAVANRISAFRGDRPGDTFRGWLWGITQNKLKEFFRRRASEPPAPGGSPYDTQLFQVPERPIDDSASETSATTKARLVQRTLELIRDDFENHTWQAFWRAAVNAEKTREIADDLGMSPKSVRQAKYRVLRRLHDELECLE